MDVYKNRGDSNTHPKHMILWRTYNNKDKNTGLLWEFYEHGDVHVMVLKAGKEHAGIKMPK